MNAYSIEKKHTTAYSSASVATQQQSSHHNLQENQRNSGFQETSQRRLNGSSSYQQQQRSQNNQQPLQHVSANSNIPQVSSQQTYQPRYQKPNQLQQRDSGNIQNSRPQQTQYVPVSKQERTSQNQSYNNSQYQGNNVFVSAKASPSNSTTYPVNPQKGNVTHQQKQPPPANDRYLPKQQVVYYQKKSSIITEKESEIVNDQTVSFFQKQKQELEDVPLQSLKDTQSIHIKDAEQLVVNTTETIHSSSSPKEVEQPFKDTQNDLLLASICSERAAIVVEAAAEVDSPKEINQASEELFFQNQIQAHNDSGVSKGIDTSECQCIQKEDLIDDQLQRDTIEADRIAEECRAMKEKCVPVEFACEWTIWICFSPEQSVSQCNNSHQDEEMFFQNNLAVISFSTLRELSLVFQQSRLRFVSDFFTFKQIRKLQFSESDSVFRTVDAVSFFKKGIKPIWEDEKNVRGQDLSTKFPGASATQIDEIYQYLLSHIVSEEYPFLAETNGFRLADKGNTKRSGIRLEVWFDEINADRMIQANQYFTSLIHIKWTSPVCMWKSHSK